MQLRDGVPEIQPGQQLVATTRMRSRATALRKGLQVEAERGVNPFKHGIIGSTDNHNGTPGDTAENDFAGTWAKPTARRTFAWG